MDRTCALDGETYDAEWDLDHCHSPNHPNHYDYEKGDPDYGWQGKTCAECPDDMRTVARPDGGPAWHLVAEGATLPLGFAGDDEVIALCGLRFIPGYELPEIVRGAERSDGPDDGGPRCGACEAAYVIPTPPELAAPDAADEY